MQKSITKSTNPASAQHSFTITNSSIRRIPTFRREIVSRKWFPTAVLSYLQNILSINDRAHWNAPASRRIIGYQCKNPTCGKVFANLFTYDQHRNHVSARVWRCVLNSPAFAGWTVLCLFCMLGHCQVWMERTAQSACGCGCHSASAQSDEHAAFYTLDDSAEFRGHALNSAKER